MSASVFRPRLRTTTVAAVLSGVVLLAGCSGGDSAGGTTTATETTPQAGEAAEPAGPYPGMEPVEILTLAQETAAEAKSVRMHLKGDSDGDQVTMNIAMNRAGRADGKISMDSQGSMRFVRVGKKGWILPGKDMLAEIAGGDKEVEKFMRGQWMEAHADDPDMKENYEITDMDWVMKEYLSTSTEADGITQVEGKKFGKRETVGLADEAAVGTMYVAADGSGELVAFVEPETVTRFSDWNKKVKAKKPAKILTDEELGL